MNGLKRPFSLVRVLWFLVCHNFLLLSIMHTGEGDFHLPHLPQLLYIGKIVVQNQKFAKWFLCENLCISLYHPCLKTPSLVQQQYIKGTPHGTPIWILAIRIYSWKMLVGSKVHVWCAWSKYALHVTTCAINVVCPCGALQSP